MDEKYHHIISSTSMIFCGRVDLNNKLQFSVEILPVDHPRPLLEKAPDPHRSSQKLVSRTEDPGRDTRSEGSLKFDIKVMLGIVRLLMVIV